MRKTVRDNNVIFFLVLSYFSIAYFTQLQEIQNKVPQISFLPFIVLFIAYLYINDKKSFSNYIYNNVLLNVYIILLGAVLTTTTFFSINPIYSLLRVFITIINLLITFTVFLYIIHRMSSDKEEWKYTLSKILFLSAIVIIVGQLLIPEWKAGIGGIRLSGGTNPNLAGFFGFFIVFWSHFVALLEKRWGKMNVALCVSGSIILFWSFSRSVLLSLVVLYTFYFMSKALLFIIDTRLKKISLLYVSSLLFLLALIFLSVLFVDWTIMFDNIRQTDLYKKIATRLFGTDGFESRYAGWEILISYFKNNPLFGSLGWWYSSDVLAFTEQGIAKSPHSLYVRLLAEVGIIGTMTVLVLPLFTFVSLIYISFCNIKYKHIYLKLMFLSSAILATFTGQFFEDKYLVGIGEMNNSVVVWIMSLSFIYIRQAKKIWRSG